MQTCEGDASQTVCPRKAPPEMNGKRGTKIPMEQQWKRHFIWQLKRRNTGHRSAFMKPKSRYLSVWATILVAMLMGNCSSPTNVNRDTGQQASQMAVIALDTNSRVASPFFVASGSGDTLSIEAGTTILKDESGAYSPISPGSKVEITLNVQKISAAQHAADSLLVAAFSITGKIDGVNSDLVFQRKTGDTQSAMPNSGAALRIVLSNSTITRGAKVSFYKILASGAKSLVGSVVLDVPEKSLGKRVGGEGNSATVSPDGTGNFQGSYLPPIKSDESSFPPGVYWQTYSNIPDTTYTIGSVTIGGPLFVGQVSIGEPSTHELLADLGFSSTAACVTGNNPNDNSQYWVERTQDASGKTTKLKVGSNAANKFYLNLILYSQDGLPVLNAYGLKSDDGVHAPDGSILDDPYSDPDKPIAGEKELHFTADLKLGRSAQSLFEARGFEISHISFENGTYSFSTRNKLEGRAKWEKDILEKNHWFPIKTNCNGNIGYYKYSNKFTGKITISWNYLGVVLFTIEMNDAKLTMKDDGPDETNYTLTGTAVISPKSCSLGTLSESESKAYYDEYGFKVLKTDPPRVRWGFAESWNYVSSNDIPLLIIVNWFTWKSMGVPYDVPIKDLNTLDGSYNMDYLMPAYGGTATWKFTPVTE